MHRLVTCSRLSLIAAPISALCLLAACGAYEDDPGAPGHAEDTEALADDGVAAEARHAPAAPRFAAGDVLGFETAAAWRGRDIQGTSPDHSEGAASLAVRLRSRAELRSAAFAFTGIPRRLRLDVQGPAPRHRAGRVELELACAGGDRGDRFTAEAAWTGGAPGAFTTLDFVVPPHVQRRWSAACPALQVAITLDVPGASGTVHLDHLRILGDLILHYRFDGTAGAAGAVDSSGYGRHGTLNGAASLTPAGRTGGGLLLDGATGFVTLPDGITDGLVEITLATWIHMAQDRAWSRIFDFGGATGFLYLTPSIGNGQLRASTFAGFGVEGTVVAPSLPVGVWKHVAVTTRGTDYRVYVDGVEAGNLLTVPVTPAQIGAGTGASWLGRSRFPDPLLAGRLDDVRIYDRALSAAEIRALAAPQSDYVSYRFDERRGAAIIDASDLARHGTLIGERDRAAGLYGRALALDGATDHVELPAGIVADCRDFTVSAWMKLRANRPWNRVFDFGAADLSGFMYLSPAGFGPFGQELRFGLITPRGILDVGQPMIIPEGEWHHVAVALRAGTLALYFNGRAVQTRTGVAISPADMGATLRNYLGKSQFPDALFDGDLDDLRITCRGLDAREIQQLAHVPLGEVPAQRELTGDLRDVHDPAIVQAGGRSYLYSTGPGLLVRTSDDLRDWRFAGQVFATNPAWVVQRFGDLPSLWAPDVAYFGGAYHLYYSASTFGSNRSCIGHATKASLASPAPWQDLGPVICSNQDGSVDDWNAIDPHVVLDEAGTPWMSFGSFWGGLKLIRLTAAGARADAELRALASPPSTAIEAPYIVYRAPYYYLFASFDSCCRGAASTYNVRVGRATSVTGPYLDRTGLDMRSGGGTPVVAGNARWAGPGHNAVLRTHHRWWNVYHAYDVLAAGVPTLRISELTWQDGWPVSGEP